MKDAFNLSTPLRLAQLASNPVGENGAIFFNTASDRFKLYQRSGWRDLADQEWVQDEIAGSSSGLAIVTIDTSGTLSNSTHYLVRAAGLTLTLPVGASGYKIHVQLAEGIDVESSNILFNRSGTDLIEGDTSFTLDLNDTWVEFVWNVDDSQYEVRSAVVKGLSNASDQTYPVEDTATNVDALFPMTHGLGIRPQSLVLWVEASAGKWETHDPSTYILATATQLEATATTLASVVGGSTNVHIIAAAGANVASIPDASDTQSGLMNISAQSFAGDKTFEDLVTFNGGIVGGNNGVINNGTATAVGGNGQIGETVTIYDSAECNQSTYTEIAIITLNEGVWLVNASVHGVGSGGVTGHLTQIRIKGVVSNNLGDTAMNSYHASGDYANSTYPTKVISIVAGDANKTIAIYGLSRGIDDTIRSRITAVRM